jgi:HAD superfamily hydrolase (TIGR01459 family)
MSRVEIVSGLMELSEKYDALLCDIWGVVHNGIEPFEAAIDALQAYRKNGGRVVLITNAPRPSASLFPQFDQIGVPHDIYDHVVSSGDVTRQALERFRGANVFHLGPERDAPLLEGLDLAKTKLADAAFILCSGLFDDETETPEDYKDFLEEALALNMEIICANPDIVVQRGDRLIYCGGAIASAYEEIGGLSTYAGKPHTPIYDHCFMLLKQGGWKPDRARALVVGDGPKTDIRGAQNQGFDSLFIGGGIHSEDCFTQDGTLDEKGMHEVFGEEGSWPTFALPWLVE